MRRDSEISVSCPACVSQPLALTLIILSRPGRWATEMDKIERLKRRIAETEADLQSLKSELAEAEAQHQDDLEGETWRWPLSAGEYERYGRQLIIPSVGIKGEDHLPRSRCI